MTPDQLEIVVARTGHERFRWLTGEDNPDAERREAYRAIVAEWAEARWPMQAEGDGDPTPAVGATAAPPRLTLATIRTRMGRSCFYGGPPPCGTCQGLAWCHALGRVVSVRDCTACLKDLI